MKTSTLMALVATVSSEASTGPLGYNQFPLNRTDMPEEVGMSITGGFEANTTCIDSANLMWDNEQYSNETKTLKSGIQANNFIDMAVECGFAYGYHAKEQGCVQVEWDSTTGLGSCEAYKYTN